VSAGARSSARVVVVGAGPSGLRVATDLASLLDDPVLVLEREAVAGGVPRHCDHLGYGMRDLGRLTTGPRYARIMVARAEAAGARIRTSTMVTGWAGERGLEVTSPAGREVIRPDVIILATGARERPRAARLIPGVRCQGIYTTGELQNEVHIKHRPVGTRAVVVGAEPVSWSAVLTLRHAGCRTAALVTAYERPESYAVLNAIGRGLAGVPVATGSRVVRILGGQRVSGVEIERVATGQRTVVACDTVVTTGDWIPNNELARAAGLLLDPVSRAPVVDSALRTDRDGVFAIGNLVHPVESADAAALDGSAVVAHVLDYLGRGSTHGSGYLELAVAAPLRWVSPARIDVGIGPPRDRLLMWTDRFHAAPVVTASQGGRVLARRRVPWPAAPGRMFRAPSSILDGIEPSGGVVTLAIEG